jgi:hypothetical protein
MLAKICAGIAVALVFGTSVAWATCSPTRNCVNLDLVPHVSRQITLDELVARRSGGPEARENKVYTGPTIGLAPTTRMRTPIARGQTPTVGYRWSLD